MVSRSSRLLLNDTTVIKINKGWPELQMHINRHCFMAHMCNAVLVWLNALQWESRHVAIIIVTRLAVCARLAVCFCYRLAVCVDMLHLSINSASPLMDTNLSLHLMTIKLRFAVLRVFLIFVITDRWFIFPLIHILIHITIASHTPDSHGDLCSPHVSADVFDELEQKVNLFLIIVFVQLKNVCLNG